MDSSVEKKGVFELSIKVVEKDIDELHHVNNEVYLSWVLNAATAHSDFLGYPFERFMEMGFVFVVRRHELDYLLPAEPNDELVIRTWVESMEGARCYRVYEISRPSDQKVIFKARTLWVYINLKTRRPAVIAPEIMERFKSISAEI